MPDDRSLGEAHRRIDDLVREVGGKLDRDVYNADQKANDARHIRNEQDISQLLSRIRGFVWTLLGAILAAVAGGVIIAMVSGGFK